MDVSFSLFKSQNFPYSNNSNYKRYNIVDGYLKKYNTFLKYLDMDYLAKSYI